MRLTPPKTTKLAELEYYKQIKPIVDYIHDSFNSIVMPVYSKKSVQSQIVITDAYATALSQLNAAMAKFEAKVDKKFTAKDAQKIATKVIDQQVKRNKLQWKTKAKSFGINIKGKQSFKGEPDYIKSRIETNTTLIKNLKSQYIEDLNIELSAAYEKGIPSGQLAKQIEKRFGISKNRAKLIARNETKNTNSQLNKKQAMELGFGNPRWHTNMDGRERPQHAKHNGKEYEFGVGLPDGDGGKEEPGDAINCRCDFYIEV